MLIKFEKNPIAHYDIVAAKTCSPVQADLFWVIIKIEKTPILPDITTTIDTAKIKLQMYSKNWASTTNHLNYFV